MWPTSLCVDLNYFLKPFYDLLLLCYFFTTSNDRLKTATYTSFNVTLDSKFYFQIFFQVFYLFLFPLVFFLNIEATFIEMIRGSNSLGVKHT